MMNTYQKILTGAVVILVVLNVTLLAVMWNKSMNHERWRGHKFLRERAEPRISERLGFDSDQQKAFNTLQQAHRKKTREFGRNTRELNRELHRAIVNKDSAAENTVGEKMDSLHELIKKENFEYIRSISEICAPDQKDELLKFLDEMPDRHGHKGHKKMKYKKLKKVKKDSL